MGEQERIPLIIGLTNLSKRPQTCYKLLQAVKGFQIIFHSLANGSHQNTVPILRPPSSNHCSPGSKANWLLCQLRRASKIHSPPSTTQCTRPAAGGWRLRSERCFHLPLCFPFLHSSPQLLPKPALPANSLTTRCLWWGQQTSLWEPLCSGHSCSAKADRLSSTHVRPSMRGGCG